MLAGCAPGIVWPIDSSHQRWTGASIKKHRALALVGGSLSNFPTALCVESMSECVYVLVCDELLSHLSPLHSVGDKL